MRADTDSALSLIMAKRLQIPTYHMEAGNRCFDANVPEETNRRLVDHSADFNLAYTEHARRNLLAEGLHPRRVLVTGSPMREVLDHYRSAIDASAALEEMGGAEGEHFLVSAHREENVDSPERLGLLAASLNAVAAEWGLHESFRGSPVGSVRHLLEVDRIILHSVGVPVRADPGEGTVNVSAQGHGGMTRV